MGGRLSKRSCYSICYYQRDRTALSLLEAPIRLRSRNGINFNYFPELLSSSLRKIAFFLQDYPNAVKTAIELDTKIQTGASTISPHYADLVALSLRQAMSAMEFTIQKGSNGQWNTSDIKAFMKNIATVGNGGYEVTVICPTDLFNFDDFV